jgi:hypothetical protein
MAPMTVRDGLLAVIQTLPEHLRKSLTWDQGTELTKHREITLATTMDIYFCDPHSCRSPKINGRSRHSRGRANPPFCVGASARGPRRNAQRSDQRLQES